MVRRFYTFIFYIITPFILLRLLYRARRAPAYGQRVQERFGFFKPPKTQGGIWLHAVSVGEVIASVPLVKRLQQQYPHLPITITTMTPTGSERVKALFGDSVFHVYAPYDLPGSIQRCIKRLQPALLIIMETELWPNTVHYCQKSAVAVVLANARLSAKSARGYQRFKPLTQGMLQGLDCVAAQHQADAERFLSLGLPAANVDVTGSIKFDLTLDSVLRDQARQLKTRWSREGQRLIWIVASTHEGEDALVLQAFKRARLSCPRLLLILVPRHPERFDQVAALCRQQDLSMVRRSQGFEPGEDVAVYLGDTMGELLLLLGCSDIAFVGGSLVPRGGHNMLEPAAWGLPIITGESDFNFLAISQWLQDQGGLTVVSDEGGLAEALIQLCDDEGERQARGRAALAVVEANRGALDRLMERVKRYLM